MSVKMGKSNKLLVMILFSLIIVGAVMLVNFMSFSDIEKTIISKVEETQSIETEHAASQIENHILQVKNELVTLSQFPLMESLNIDECSGDIHIIHEDIEGKIDSLLRVDKEGNIIECSSEEFSNYIGLNIKNKDYFINPKETNKPFIAEMVRQGSSRQIIVSAPLFETNKYTPYPNFEGAFKGVLLSIIEVESVYNLYLHSILEPDKNFFLLINLDTEETIIKSDIIEDYSVIKDSLPDVSAERKIVTDFNGFGRTIVTSADLILGSDIWRLIIFTPLDSLEEETRAFQQRHLLGLAFIMLVIIAILVLLISLFRSKEEVQLRLDKAKVTLDRLGISIETEKDKFSQADISLDSGRIYLIKEDDENHAHELFISSLNRGFAGLGIIRENPRSFRKRYNLQKTSFIWLTESKAEGVPAETGINNLYALISEFIKKSKKSVILIDRLDYILSENRFEDVIKRIRSLKDITSTSDCIIILSINPELIARSQLKSIEAETIDLYGKHLERRVDLSDMERDLLDYINERNSSNRMVSYKDVTSKFNITKPTTRSKVTKLKDMGLIQVEQKGRVKSIKITSSGRRLIR